MAGARRKYTRDYKEAAVALAGQADKTVGQVAQELGINVNMLVRWRAELREGQEGTAKAFPGKGNPRDEELVRLRKRVSELEEVNEILKKAAGRSSASSLRKRPSNNGIPVHHE
jgi:transposase